jgi:hypothetical protein
VRQRNYTGTLTERFAELADVGTDGCGIEQHLEAVKRALDGNPQNTGFLRPDAYLAVIVIADEDDCSLAQSTLFAGDPASSTYGDLVNFRCTRQGVECETPSTDLEIVGPRQDCHPRYDTTQLTQLERYVDFLKGLKADPYDVVVAGIVGDEGPFEIIKKPNEMSVLKPSCSYTGPTGEQFAYPAIRTAEFLRGFPTRNTRATICEGDLSAALTQVGVVIKDALGEPCFQNPLLDVDLETPGDQYDCAITEIRHRINQEPEEVRVLAACDPTHSRLPCWTIEADAVTCSYVPAPHLKLVIDRGGEIPAPDIRIKASCVTTSASGSLF